MQPFFEYFKSQRPWFLRKIALVLFLIVLLGLLAFGAYSSIDYYNNLNNHSAVNWSVVLKPLWQAPIAATGIYFSCAALTFLWILRRYIYILQHGKEPGT
jgi:hypothetical protein